MNYKRLNTLRTSTIKYGVLIKKLSKLSEKGFQKIFFEVVENGDVDCASFLLANSQNPTKMINTCNKFGTSPLMISSFLQNYDMTKFLLENGAEANLQDTNGIQSSLLCDDKLYVIKKFWNENLVFDGQEHLWHKCGGTTALMMLLCQRDANIEIAKLLLEHGANVNIKNKEGFSALMFAVEVGNVEATKLLIKHGANVNERDVYGNSVLLHAVSNMYIKDLVPTLVFSGANPEIANQFGRSCRSAGFANEKGQKEIDESIKWSKLAKLLNIAERKDVKLLESNKDEIDCYLGETKQEMNERIMA